MAISEERVRRLARVLTVTRDRYIWDELDGLDYQEKGRRMAKRNKLLREARIQLGLRPPLKRPSSY